MKLSENLSFDIKNFQSLFSFVFELPKAVRNMITTNAEQFEYCETEKQFCCNKPAVHFSSQTFSGTWDSSKSHDFQGRMWLEKI